MKRLVPYLLPAVFGLLFIVTALFVLAYALGYQIDLKHRRIEKTGLAYLTSFPSGGFITVDGHYIKKKTPNKTRPLLPGKHELKVQKDGYIPWVERAMIRPELATLFEHILLYPIKPKTSRLVAKGVVDSTLVSSDGNRLIYTVSNGADAGIWTANLDLTSPNRLLPLTRLLTPSTSSVEIASFTQFTPVALSSDGSTMLVSATKPGGAATLLVPLSNPTAAIVLTDAYRDFTNFGYEIGQAHRIYATKSGALYRIDTASSAAPTLIADSVVAYASKSGALSYVRSTTTGLSLFSSASDGTRPQLLLSKLTDNEYALEVDPSTDAVALLSVPDGQLRVISRNTEQQIQVLIVGSGYSFMKWSRTDSHLLYGGASGAFVYDLPDVVTTQARTPSTLPQNIAWLYDAFHLIVSENTQAMIGEVDGQNTAKLGRSSSLPAYSNNSKDLYLADPSGALLAQSTRQAAD